MINPDSYVLTASSNGGLDYLQKVEDHVVNTSSKFSKKNVKDDTGNSGDYGITITPDAAGESWELALWFDADNRSGIVRAWVDPGASISNPIDTTSGSSKSSPATGTDGVLSSNATKLNTLQSEFLLAESDDVIAFVQKRDTADEDVETFGLCGRPMVPFYNDDSSNDFDGLGNVAVEAPDSTNFDGHLRTGDSNWASVTNVAGGYQQPSTLANGRDRANPNVMEISKNRYGPCKWFYTWFRSVTNLARVEDSNGSGGLLILGQPNDNSSTRVAIPWDPNTSPT